MALVLNVLATYPNRASQINVESDVTMGELRKLIEKSLKIDLEGYGLSAVLLGEDVSVLTKQDDTFKPKLAPFTTIVAIAPLSALPIKQNKDRKDTELADRFRGLTHDNIFIKISKIVSKKQKLAALEFLDIYTADIVKTKTFLKLSFSTLRHVLKRDTLAIDEIDLFEAVIAWGESQQKAEGKTVTPHGTKTAIAELLPLIRFPLISTEHLASQVVPRLVLSPEQTLELFTYQAQKDVPGTTPPAGYISKPRNGEVPAAPPL